MSNSTVRFPNSSSITLFARVTRAIECGFIAAGVTVAVLAAIESVSIIVSWLAAS